MTDTSAIPVHEILALLGQKELEIYMLRKALAQLQAAPPPQSHPGDSSTQSPE